MLITFFFFFFFCLSVFFFNRLWSTRNLWLAEKQWTVYFTGTPKAVDKDFQRRAVCFLCMTVPILILLREWITSDESWCDADQPTTLFTWPHASRHFSPKVKTTPFHNQKGKISGHWRRQEQHNCRIKGLFFFWIPSAAVLGSFQKAVRSVFQWWEIKQFIFCVSCVRTVDGHTGAVCH